jgi:hypothetical protein
MIFIKQQPGKAQHLFQQEIQFHRQPIQLEQLHHITQALPPSQALPQPHSALLQLQ